MLHHRSGKCFFHSHSKGRRSYSCRRSLAVAHNSENSITLVSPLNNALCFAARGLHALQVANIVRAVSQHALHSKDVVKLLKVVRLYLARKMIYGHIIALAHARGASQSIFAYRKSGSSPSW